MPPIKLKLRLQIGEKLLVATGFDCFTLFKMITCGDALLHVKSSEILWLMVYHPEHMQEIGFWTWHELTPKSEHGSCP
jgi:hypothetical protein